MATKAKTAVRKTAKAATIAPAPTISNPDPDVAKVMAALAAQAPRRQQSTGLQRMVQTVAQQVAFDLAAATPAEKAAFTRRIKLAAKTAGISL